MNKHILQPRLAERDRIGAVRERNKRDGSHSSPHDTYEYDRLSRLTSVTQSFSFEETTIEKRVDFTYTAAGRRQEVEE